jgi:hypothetical protein
MMLVSSWVNSIPKLIVFLGHLEFWDKWLVICTPEKKYFEGDI